jgi:hypothetical protein
MHPPLSGGFHASCQAFVPALAFLRLFRPRSRFVDEITALDRALSLWPSRRSNPQFSLGQPCLRPKPLTRLPSLPLPVTSPAEPRLAFSFIRTSHFGLADDRFPFSTKCCRACSAGDETDALPRPCGHELLGSSASAMAGMSGSRRWDTAVRPARRAQSPTPVSHTRHEADAGSPPRLNAWLAPRQTQNGGTVKHSPSPAALPTSRRH